MLLHLRRRSRGCENTRYQASKENEFSPVHSVTRFQRLKPPAFESCGVRKIKDNDRVTNARPLGRLQDQKATIAQLERDFGAQLNGRLDEPAARGSFLLHAATLIMFEISLLVIAAQQTSHRPDLSVLFCHSGNRSHPCLHSRAGRAGVPGPDGRSLLDRS